MVPSHQPTILVPSPSLITGASAKETCRHRREDQDRSLLAEDLVSRHLDNGTEMEVLSAQLALLNWVLSLSSPTRLPLNNPAHTRLPMIARAAVSA